MAKTPLPPWRRAEREDADQDRRVEIMAIQTPRCESMTMWFLYRIIVANTLRAAKDGSKFEDGRTDVITNLRNEYEALMKGNAHKQRLEDPSAVQLYLKNLSEHKYFDVGPNKDNSPISGNTNARYLSCSSDSTMGFTLLVRITVSNFYEHYTPEMLMVIEGYLRKLLSQRELCYRISRTTEKEQLINISQSWGCIRSTNEAEKMWESAVESCLSTFTETEEHVSKKLLPRPLY